MNMIVTFESQRTVVRTSDESTTALIVELAIYELLKVRRLSKINGLGRKIHNKINPLHTSLHIFPGQKNLPGTLGFW